MSKRNQIEPPLKMIEHTLVFQAALSVKELKALIARAGQSSRALEQHCTSGARLGLASLSVKELRALIARAGQ